MVPDSQAHPLTINVKWSRIWCGISPDNSNAAWIWTGNQFVTKEHGDVRTNEWVAWSLTPVGTPSPDLFDDDGTFALFTNETERVTADIVEVQSDPAEPAEQTPIMAQTIRTGNATAQQRTSAQSAPVVASSTHPSNET